MQLHLMGATQHHACSMVLKEGCITPNFRDPPRNPSPPTLRLKPQHIQRVIVVNTPTTVRQSIGTKRDLKRHYLLSIITMIIIIIRSYMPSGKDRGKTQTLDNEERARLAPKLPQSRGHGMKPIRRSGQSFVTP